MLKNRMFTNMIKELSRTKMAELLTNGISNIKSVMNMKAAELLFKKNWEVSQS